MKMDTHNLLPLKKRVKDSKANENVTPEIFFTRKYLFKMKIYIPSGEGNFFIQDEHVYPIVVLRTICVHFIICGGKKLFYLR